MEAGNTLDQGLDWAIAEEPQTVLRYGLTVNLLKRYGR